MMRTFRAELVKLRRPRVMLITAFATIVFAFVSAAVVLASAEPAATQPEASRGPSVEALSSAGGGTEVFTAGASFAGTFVFVVFVGAIAVEFSRGTIRTMLLRQPRRISLLAGKLAALLAFAAVVLASAEVLTWIAARLLAPGQDISTGDWSSVSAIGHAATDYAMAMFWVTGYAILGMTLAVLARSVPVALAVGVAWAGPVEHLVSDGWVTANRVFPGLLLEAFVADGTTDVSTGHAFATLIVYLVAAGAIAMFTFARRDVTS